MHSLKANGLSGPSPKVFIKRTLSSFLALFKEGPTKISHAKINALNFHSLNFQLIYSTQLASMLINS
ncbi:MAG: hypothetical protein COB51_08330 [Moraxellaceae bacterium]|nr:MAG: hypothetical protein COB51_08330 [Moraxellaceae bacterium]